MGRGRGAIRGGDLEGLHVLLVDDNATSRDTLHTVLEHNGALVTDAASTEAALDRLGRFVPEVIVCDLDLEGGRGARGLLRELRGRSPAAGGRVPVVALARDAHAHPMSEVLDWGCQGYVMKPFEVWRLCRVVADVADAHRASDR